MTPLRLSLPAALLALTLTACAGITPPETATLPRDFTTGAGDPTRGAVFEASGTFARPARLQGQPAAAARALATMEYLTVALPQDPQLSPRLDGLTELQLLAARREWRSALGVPETAPAQGVIDGLFVASSALEANDRGVAGAALPSGLFPVGPETTLSRLAALPPLPETGLAAQMAQRALERQNENSRNSSGTDYR